MLTKREKDTLEFIQKFIERHGESPLVSEIAEGIGIQSHGTTHRYINSLIEAGELERLPLRARALKIVAPGDPSSLVMPMMGKIAAGRLIEAVPDETEIDLGEMFAGKGRFVLKISGDSMIEKGIMPGDFVVVESTNVAKHEDIVVALVDGYEATLKTLLMNDDETVTLMPANDAFEAVTLDPKRLNIQGVVVGQLRTYS